MSTLNVTYAVWVGRRQRRRRESGLRPFHSESYSLPHRLLEAQRDPMLDGQTLKFLFWSVRGDANGPSIFFERHPIVNIIPVNNQDAVATAVYALPGEGNHPGEYGYDIDAFDVNAGDFVDVEMDFVSAVEPDSNLAQRANDEGFVPTTMMENIQANSSISAEEFADWRVWKDMEEDSIENSILSANAGGRAIALAFYVMSNQPIPVAPTKPFVAYDLMTTFLLNWLATHGHGESPISLYVRQFASGLMLTETASLVSPQLKHAILDVAARQVSLAAGLIRSEILAGKKPLQADQISTSTAMETMVKDEILAATTHKGNGKQSTSVMTK
jgi:hypothetical protein